MTLIDLLSEVRGIYTRQLSEVLSAHGGALSEAAYRNSNGDLALEGALDLPARLDILPRTESGFGNAVVVDSPTQLSFQPFTLQWSDSLSATISPFIWDCCKVSLSGVSAAANFEPIRAWFFRWFDLDDKSRTDSAGLYGVVHFLSDPKATEDGATFITDLGSAAVEAFEQLLDSISEMGVSQAHVS